MLQFNFSACGEKSIKSYSLRNQLIERLDNRAQIILFNSFKLDDGVKAKSKEVLRTLWRVNMEYRLHSPKCEEALTSPSLRLIIPNKILPYLF